jgi:hypothetical protein
MSRLTYCITQATMSQQTYNSEEMVS